MNENIISISSSDDEEEISSRKIRTVEEQTVTEN